MEKLKERAVTVALVIGTLWLLSVVFAPILNSMGNTAAASPGASASWGFVWLAQNLGWVFVLVFVLLFIGVVFWEIYKGRH